MFKLSYGLFVVTAREGEKDNGCVTNTVMQVTVSPNRITLAVNKQNYTHDMIKRTGKFNVSVLSEQARFDTFKHWGFQSGKEVDKAVGITFSRADNGVIYITEGVNAVLCAQVCSEVELGTHTLFVADVTDAFCLCSLGKAIIHVCPLVVLASGGICQVLRCIANAIVQFLVPHLGMFFLIVGSVLEDGCYLLKTIFLCTGCKIGVLVTCL